jgi:hypothetical protein
MAKVNYSLSVRGSAVTFKVEGKQPESFSAEFLEMDEVYDRIRWMAVTQGIVLSQKRIIQMVKEAKSG